MKIAANKIDGYIESNLGKIKAILLYGPDLGLQAERIDVIKAKILGDNPDPFLLVKLEAKKILEDPAILHVEANSMSLIAGTKLIIISDAANNLTNEFNELLENLKGDSFIIIRSGDLAASSKLRKLAETRADILAAPCYIDDQLSLTNIIRKKLSNYQFSADLPSYIASFFSGDRLLLNAELEKLFLYLGDKKEITADDVDEVICSSKEENFQEIVNKVSFKDFLSAEQEIKRHIKQGIYPVTIVRALINYHTRLLMVKSQMQDGANIQIAMNSLRPPVFFKQKEIMIKHLNSWHLKEIQVFLQILERLEILFKSEAASFAEIIFLAQLQKFFYRK